MSNHSCQDYGENGKLGKKKGKTDGDIAIQAVYEGAFFERSWPEVVGAVF